MSDSPAVLDQKEPEIAYAVGQVAQVWLVDVIKKSARLKKMLPRFFSPVPVLAEVVAPHFP